MTPEPTTFTQRASAAVRTCLLALCTIPAVLYLLARIWVEDARRWLRSRQEARHGVDLPPGRPPVNTPPASPVKPLASALADRRRAA